MQTVLLSPTQEKEPENVDAHMIPGSEEVPAFIAEFAAWSASGGYIQCRQFYFIRIFRCAI